MTTEERDELIDALIDGEISEADFVRLEAEMHVDADTRRAYYDRMKLSTLLAINAENAKLEVAPSTTTHWRWWVAAAAAITFLAVGGWLGWSLGDRSGAPVAKKEPAASGFGVVAEQLDAQWDLERGDLLPLGELALGGGLVQMELFSGVTVTVEGAAVFELHSPMEMSITSGKVRAHVPEPARGFRIHTANGDIVDLGTEFIIDVSDKGADLHVLDGEVEWHPAESDMRTLHKGEAIRGVSTGAEALQFEEDRFGASRDFAKRRSARREAWLRHSDWLASDPRTLVYYRMGDVSNGQLSDHSRAHRHGTTVVTRSSSDRWGTPGGALDFSPTGSRVRVNLPGEHGSLTFYCWAKIDSLDRLFNSLFLTDGHELNEPHWQIMNDGRLSFSVKKQNAPPDKHIFYSPPFWSHARSGQWIQIATTYDLAAKKVTHFINGQPVGSEPIPPDFVVEKVTIGAASIANWSEPAYRKDASFAVRNLNGSIDEFAIFNQALSAKEIRKLYTIGKP